MKKSKPKPRTNTGVIRSLLITVAILLCLSIASLATAEDEPFYGKQSVAATGDIERAARSASPTDQEPPLPAPAPAQNAEGGITPPPTTDMPRQLDQATLDHFGTDSGTKAPSRAERKRGAAPDGKSETTVMAPSGESEDDITSELDKIKNHSNAVQMVYDEGFQAVEIALKDISRLVCSSDISKIVYSKEKNIEIKAAGKDAFIKILPVESVDPATGTFILKYDKRPKEAYVLCGNNTYSLLLLPRDIPATTIYLKSSLRSKEEADKYERATDYENTIFKLIKDIYREDVPAGYDVADINTLAKAFQEGDIMHKRDYTGDYFQIQEYIVYAKEAITLDEAQLVQMLQVKNPLAATIVDTTLKPKQQTRLLVVRLNNE